MRNKLQVNQLWHLGINFYIRNRGGQKGPVSDQMGRSRKLAGESTRFNREWTLGRPSKWRIEGLVSTVAAHYELAGNKNDLKAKESKINAEMNYNNSKI